MLAPTVSSVGVVILSRIQICCHVPASWMVGGAALSGGCRTSCSWVAGV